jgi:serine/threonine protein kinase
MGMPTEFGRYRVRKQLGGGGMGAVYLVENTELKREEALKVPHFGVGDDPVVRERFLREARAAAQLDHPNLCPVYDVGTINGVCFLTMRYLKGKLLSDYTGKPQPPRKAVEITAKLAQALESAHSKGVIHRDLKPNNVMMCAGVGPVVMDFGLAKQTKSEDQKLTQAGTTMGFRCKSDIRRKSARNWSVAHFIRFVVVPRGMKGEAARRTLSRCSREKAAPQKSRRPAQPRIRYAGGRAAGKRGPRRCSKTLSWPASGRFAAGMFNQSAQPFLAHQQAALCAGPTAARSPITPFFVFVAVPIRKPPRGTLNLQTSSL